MSRPADRGKSADVSTMFKPLMATAVKPPIPIVKTPRKNFGNPFGATVSGIEYIESADLLNKPFALVFLLCVNGH